LAVAQNTLRLSAIINLINQLVEPVIVPLAQSYDFPRLTMRPEANCNDMRRCICAMRWRYERLIDQLTALLSAWDGNLRTGFVGLAQATDPYNCA
jgi:hypothetical protein